MRGGWNVRGLAVTAASMALVLAGVMVFCGPLRASSERGILIVDDDGSRNLEQPFLDELATRSRPVQTWDVDQQGLPSNQQITTPALVIWVSGGFRGRLTPRAVDLIEERINARGNTLLVGLETGRALNWGWRDRWYFGFEYRDTTFFRENIVRDGGFGRGFEAETDYGQLTGGQVLYELQPRRGRDESRRGAPVAIRAWSRGARTAWAGFDVGDLWSSWDQRQVARDLLWHVDFSVAEALAELRDGTPSKARRAHLLRSLQEELLREGPGDGPVWTSVEEAATGQADVARVLQRARRLTATW